MVIWITGLSGAGKTTLADKLAKHYRGLGYPVLQIDGDEMRKILNFQSSYDQESRIRISQIYSKMASYASEQGLLVIVSVIGLFKETFEWNRKNLISYFEIFMDTPMEELKKRNSKNLYNNPFDTQTIVGVSLEMHYPDHSDLYINFDPLKTPDQVAQNCINEFDVFIKQSHPHRGKIASDHKAPT